MIFIIEKFVSVQGEGLNVGTPALFIRLAQCNLRCPWCDTKYSWRKGTPISIEDLVNYVLDENLPLVVLTGGEPLIYSYEIAEFLRRLRERGYEGKVQIETNGTIEPRPLRGFDNYVLSISPKVTCVYKVYFVNLIKRIINNYNVLEIKIVVSNDDIKCLRQFIDELGDVEVPLIVQPLHRPNSNYAMDSKAIVEEILSDPSLRRKVRVIPQLHKLIGIK
ncbi:7-carboxy-7-deazaguanine synthase QueE [Ignicoccus islandicus]|nr:7-carboxy-7-deazaguanine synthase QueE [Ignicoccus islandicus]